jgi:hypothetical protein
MSFRSEVDKIEEIVEKTTNQLLKAVPPRPSQKLRYSVGDIQAHCGLYIADGTFGERLKEVYKLAQQSGIEISWFNWILDYIADEFGGEVEDLELSAISVLQSTILFVMAQEGRIVAGTVYTSRDDVDAAMKSFEGYFERIKHAVADNLSGPGYEALLTVMAGITRYLTDVARPLPRMVNFELPETFPCLAVSQRVYGNGSRSEEIAAENHVIHPAFCRRQLRVLSA